MARIEIQGDQLVVQIEGADKLWALKDRMTIPLRQVRGAMTDPGARPEGWRGPGAHIPGVIVAGTFHAHGHKTFWDVHDPRRAVVVDLADHEYDRLVVQVDDPLGTVAAIEAALSAH